MRVLLSLNGSEQPERFVKDLQYAGLPAHTHAIVYSTDEQLALSAFQHYEYEWSIGFTHDEIALAGVESERVARLVSSHFPQWFVEHDIADDSHAISILDIARYHRADLIVQQSDGPRGLNPDIDRELVLAREARSSVRFVREAHRHPGQPLSILVCLDGSDKSTNMVDAISMRSFPRNTRLFLLSVTNDSPQLYKRPYNWIVETFEDTANDQQREHMLTYFSKHLESHFPRIEAHLRTGDPLTQILNFAQDYQVDTIYLGAHDSNAPSVTDVPSGIIQHARTNIEIVRWPTRW